MKYRRCCLRDPTNGRRPLEQSVRWQTVRQGGRHTPNVPNLPGSRWHGRNSHNVKRNLVKRIRAPSDPDELRRIDSTNGGVRQWLVDLHDVPNLPLDQLRHRQSLKVCFPYPLKALVLCQGVVRNELVDGKGTRP